MQRPSRRLLRGLQRRVAAMALTAALVTAAAAAAATVRETLDRTFPLPAGGSLEVVNVNGSISVEVWDRDEVHVEAVEEAKGMTDDQARDALRKVRIDLTPSAGSLRVETHVAKQDDFLGWLFHGSSHVDVEYRLHVPRRFDVRAHTVNGRVSLAGTRGKADLASTNGSLELAEVEGEIRLETVNGHIDIRHAAGPVRAECTNGRIAADLTRLSGPLTLDTTNGSVTLRLPRDARAELEAGTTNGSVHSELPLTTTASSRHHLHGSLNGGGVPLKLTTTNGSVQIVAL